MSKTFEEVCSKCCRGCNSYEKDRCRDVWNASEKATEKRVLDEVIEYIGCWIKDEETDELYQPLIEGLKQKYRCANG